MISNHLLSRLNKGKRFYNLRIEHTCQSCYYLRANAQIKYLDESFTIEKLSDELNNKNSQFFFALVKHKPVGYLKVNVGDAQTELKDDGGMELQRIYVLQDYHGKSVGQALFEKAKSLAIEGGYPYLWLGVWEENHRALNFYRKNGFVPFDKHIFKMGDEEQTDWMMKLEFK